MPSAPATLKDIGLKLGLSHVTVSLALRNHPRIPEARRLQIQAEAERMGYRRNAMASGLAEYRRSIKTTPITAGLAWINHWPDPAKLATYRENALYWDGAKEAALHHGYRLEEFIHSRGASMQRLEQVLLARQVQGILIPPRNGPLFDWGGFKWDKFAVVRFGYSFPAPHVNIVTANHMGNTQLALREMRALGYRRIGFVSPQLLATKSLAGLFLEQARWPKASQIPPLALQDTPPKIREASFLGWVQKNKPDAILTEVGQVRRWLENAGYILPRDLGLAVLSIHDGGTDSGIDQRPRHIGKAAAEVVISRINNNDFGEPEVSREILIEGCWAQGSTLRRV